MEIQRHRAERSLRQNQNKELSGPEDIAWGEFVDVESLNRLRDETSDITTRTLERTPKTSGETK